jgi:hypothetical protein
MSEDYKGPTWDHWAELTARVEALEPAQRLRTFTAEQVAPVKVPITRDRDETGDYLIVHDTPAPAGSLVERVAAAICDDGEMAHLWHDDARAAIREVALWMDEKACDPDDTRLLRKEADRPTSQEDYK